MSNWDQNGIHNCDPRPPLWEISHTLPFFRFDSFPNEGVRYPRTWSCLYYTLGGGDEHAAGVLGVLELGLACTALGGGDDHAAGVLGVLELGLGCTALGGGDEHAAGLHGDGDVCVPGFTAG